jgi:PAS domain S-box-containing protein
MIPGYQIIARIYESAHSLVYRGRREQDNQPVILKLLKEDYPTPEALTRYKQEYELTRYHNFDGVIHALNLETYQNTLIIIFEDFGGESLNVWLNTHRFNIKDFLQVATQITEILAIIHQNNIIHKDINPSNIVFNPQTKQVKIIDFGISTVLNRENPTLKNPKVLEGTLAYMSPEQTGRMNRALDYRTDFYSLGATFYELLTHRLPFANTTDAMELVHCHIAKQPIAPHELNPAIPQAVSDIVMKLLAKTAEERYQSAWGIKADLQECLNQLQTKGTIEPFPLARQDFSEKFQISQKLYGREQELEILLNAFERVRQGESEIMLVSGYSGIGKSSLIQEIYKPVTRQRGYFVSGKFDQFQRDIPYSALVNAFSALVRQLLTETEDQLKQWQEKLLSAFGTNGQVIIDVIPEVELIVGKQSEAIALPPAEAQNRFNLVFQNFIRVFTQPEHPLVIFLDDLQWADTASLQLIQLLMIALESRCLFLIGAYRNNEVNAAHPLMVTLNNIQQEKASIINHIHLSNLKDLHANQLIADTLRCKPNEVRQLTELVLIKTQGNPFFMNEFLKSLYLEKLLDFDVNQGRWCWNFQEIQSQNFTDNVVELMARKIQKFSDQTQEVLQLAACIGNQFDLQILALVYKKSAKETAASLREAIAEGLVLPISDTHQWFELDVKQLEEGWRVEYKFTHDRIQQAAYSLIPPERESAIHRQVGELLLRNTPLNKREQKLFDIVNQLNFGIELISSQTEKYEVAQLNLLAGNKAKSAAAYKPAFKYLTTGIKLLEKNSWLNQYNLTLELYVEAIEAAYLIGDFEQMEELADTVLQNAKTLLDQVKAYEVKIQAYIAQNKPVDAVKTALPVLKLLGEGFPKKPSQLNLVLGLLETKLTLLGKQINDLSTLPEMSDPLKLAAMRILSIVGTAAYFAVPDLYPLILFKQVKLSVKYGNAFRSALAYATYGLALCGVVGDIESGYKFGQLALKLLEQFNAKEVKARTLFLIGYMIRHWKEPVREILPSFLESYSIGLETGDTEYAAYSAYAMLNYSYFSGKELVKLEREMVSYGHAIAQLRQRTVLQWNNLYRQVVLNLMGKSENPCFLMGESYDEEKMLPLHHEAKDRTSIFLVHFNKTILFYLFGHHESAVKNAQLAEKYIDNAKATLADSLFYFYDSLARLALYPSVQKPEQSLILKKVAANQKNLKKWAHHAPMNHLHKFYLVEAERCRVRGQAIKAINLYDRAIELAKKNKYIHEEALANELIAKLYLALGKAKLAQPYILDARYCYLKWGALAKVNHLEESYPQLLSRIAYSQSNAVTQDTKITLETLSTSSLEFLDLVTVMKASQAISGEIVLEKLLKKLMKILIENAGAQKGFLILENQQKLFIEAEGSVNSDVGEDACTTTVLQSIPLGTETSVPLPTAIINYVVRTQKGVVLNDATREGDFTNIPYIKENKPKSILCVPLINQGKLISVVYLENNLATEAFTRDRVEIIKLLSSQAAISIENAKLYSELRENESRLTQFLEAMPMGVAILDADGKPYYTNLIAQKLLGKGVVPSITLAQLAEVYQLYKAGTNQLYPKEQFSLGKALEGESSAIDDLEIHQGDKIIPIEVRSTPIFDKKRKVTYAIAAFQDITERKRAEAERKKFTDKLYKLNVAYQRFVPRQFLQLLNKDSIIDVQLGDQVRKEMSVLFADIRNFTHLSERMTPEDNFKFINSYLSCMEPAISKNNGFIDKYIGDAIMALFSGVADDAVKAAIEMLQTLADYNQHCAQTGYKTIQIGIGINTGSLMLGTVGGKNRMDGTVISDAVNLASRLEELTKDYCVSLLISHHTFERLSNPADYAIRMIDQVQVRGKAELVTVYEIFDTDLPEVREGKFATAEVFTEALSLYTCNHFRKAAQRFRYCLGQNPSDRVAQLYLERCQEQFKS